MAVRKARPQRPAGRRSADCAELRPVGVIRSTLTSRGEAPKQGHEGAPDAWLEIHPFALEALDGGRIGIGAQSVGLAQGALEAATRYAKHRRTFGHPIAEYQAIQWMLADMQTEIDAARMLTYQAAQVRDDEIREKPSGTPGPSRLGPHSARAKLYASEMANRVAYKAVQIHGSLGYSRESDVERYYRDARVLTIYEGTSEMQRLVIARDLLRAAGGR